VNWLVTKNRNHDSWFTYALVSYATSKFELNFDYFAE